MDLTGVTMAIYDKNGIIINTIYDVNGIRVNAAYDANGTIIYIKDHSVDYDDFSYISKWDSKGIGSTQGFDIYDDKVFWVQKSGNASVPSSCYVWNLSDGSQALSSQPITIYGGHGNNISFDAPKLYVTTAYNPPYVYVNEFTDSFVFSLDRTLYINDGCTDCDACIDENDNNILWTLGHMGGGATESTHFQISKWDLANLTLNGDYYEPELIYSVSTARPSNSPYFQGIRFHDGILWFASGYTAANAYVYGIDPTTGDVLHSINLNTTAEPEGVTFYPDQNAPGGFAMYVGFQGMALRKYTFEEI